MNSPTVKKKKKKVSASSSSTTKNEKFNSSLSYFTGLEAADSTASDDLTNASTRTGGSLSSSVKKKNPNKKKRPATAASSGASSSISVASTKSKASVTKSKASITSTKSKASASSGASSKSSSPKSNDANASKSRKSLTGATGKKKHSSLSPKHSSKKKAALPMRGGLQRSASSSSMLGRRNRSTSPRRTTTAASSSSSSSTGNNRGRPEPASRGVQRYSSMPTTSGHLDDLHRANLASISEHIQPVPPPPAAESPSSHSRLRRMGSRRPSLNNKSTSNNGMASSSTPLMLPKRSRSRDKDDDDSDDDMKVPLPRSMSGPAMRRAGRSPGPRAASMMNLNNSSSTNKSPRPSVRKPMSSSNLGLSIQNSFKGGGAPPPLSRNHARPPNRSQSGNLEKMRRGSNRSLHANAAPPPRSQSGNLEFMQRSQSTRTEFSGQSGLDRSQSVRPPSILRNSSHHGGGGGDRPRPRRDPSTRVTVPPSRSSRVLEGDDCSYEEVSVNFGAKSKRLTALQNTSSIDSSGHSLGQSWHTTRSMLSVDKTSAFEDDTGFKRLLRYIRILPPHPYERRDKRNVRIFTWTTLVLDFIAAMVSITTYDGVTTCCGVPMFSFGVSGINWNLSIRITTYVYLVMVFAEIIPVLRNGLPFNLLNPMVGFAITFAMFFDDRILEAVCMWVLEAMAIFLELLVYRLKSKMYHERNSRMETVEKDLNIYSKSKSQKRLATHSSHHSPHASNSDDDSISGHSFGDADQDDVELGESRNSSDDSGLTGMTGNYKLREMRLLRERRILRQTQKSDRVQLRYHFGGVVINFGLICISLVLIIVIARGGGLCIKNGSRPIVFENNQLEKCDACKGTTGVCEICDDDGTNHQCYYPYY